MSLLSYPGLPETGRVAAIVSNSGTADDRRSSSLRFGRVKNNSSPGDTQRLTNVRKVWDLHQCQGVTSVATLVQCTWSATVAGLFLAIKHNVGQKKTNDVFQIKLNLCITQHRIQESRGSLSKYTLIGVTLTGKRFRSHDTGAWCGVLVWGFYLPKQKWRWGLDVWHVTIMQLQWSKITAFVVRMAQQWQCDGQCNGLSCRRNIIKQSVRTAQ